LDMNFIRLNRLNNVLSHINIYKAISKLQIYIQIKARIKFLEYLITLKTFQNFILILTFM